MKRRENAYVKVLLDQARLESRLDMADGRLAKVVCRAPECGRDFFGLRALQDHAESVHTFSDIEQMVGEQVREQYAKPGDYKATPPISAIYAWVRDIADDWVVFVVEGTESKLYKADYTITDTKVTLGAPAEVVRRTVYDAASKEN